MHTSRDLSVFTKEWFTLFIFFLSISLVQNWTIALLLAKHRIIFQKKNKKLKTENEKKKISQRTIWKKKERKMTSEMQSKTPTKECQCIHIKCGQLAGLAASSVQMMVSSDGVYSRTRFFDPWIHITMLHTHWDGI